MNENETCKCGHEKKQHHYKTCKVKTIDLTGIGAYCPCREFEPQTPPTKCPKCKSKDLSKTGQDFIYSITEEREIPIQYCNKCHAEWFI